MKHFKLLFLLLLFIPIMSQGQLTDGLKAYYPFNGDPLDQSGNGNNGFQAGNSTLTSDRFGNESCAYYFPGNPTDYIKVNYSDDFDIDPDSSLSISLWYKGGSDSEGDIEGLFEKYNPNVSPYPSDYNIVLYDLNQPGLGSNYALLVASLNSPPIPDPNWHHVVGIYDNRNWYFYENNILRQVNTSMEYPIFQSIGDVFIGKNFEGAIDDIRFYNRVLSPADINEIYNLPSSCATTPTQDNEMVSGTIFPNPANDLIHISSEESSTIYNISAYDIVGKLIFSRVNCHSTNEHIDISNWTDGIYLFRIQTDRGVITAVVEKQP